MVQTKVVFRGSTDGGGADELDCCGGGVDELEDAPDEAGNGGRQTGNGKSDGRAMDGSAPFGLPCNPARRESAFFAW